MRILLLVHGFNSLSQRLFVELSALGHDLAVELDVNDAVSAEAVEMWQPDLILAPFLKRAIPESIWSRHLCLIVHPGVPGDRGPSALDWAILDGEEEWGVTVLQAEAEMDAGPVWGHAEFPMRPANKSSLYRNEVTEAAVTAVMQALRRFEAGHGPLPVGSFAARGQARPAMRAGDRGIDWSRDDSATVLRKLRSADGVPGVRDELCGLTVFLHDSRPAPGLGGPAGEVVARSGPAIARATTDGAVWIGHLRAVEGPHAFKLPAVRVLEGRLGTLPELPLDGEDGYREITYQEEDGVGTLSFDFYNGAMDVGQCERLLAAYRRASERPTKVIILDGGPDFWSNGIHLNVIEAADSAADESWRNINAMDDLAEAIIRDDSHLTVAAMLGNAGAGGVFLARAADRVWLRDGVVLSPHYKDMGNLFGSEFWTYLLPRHIGEEGAARIAEARLPMSASEAVAIGLGDALLAGDRVAFAKEVAHKAGELSKELTYSQLLAEKQERRAADEAAKPLHRYREEELERMRLNFYGFDPSYHVARYNFVHKVAKSRTPPTIARHRDRRRNAAWRNAS